ncbi:hypothetical protein OIPHN330_12140 [Citrobacter freundii]|nr:hypothetical protein OIPHN330_12140 [Citrobacter freundii]GCB42607.1 hypothetical protein CITFRE_47420 [Citrobacter freundii]
MFCKAILNVHFFLMAQNDNYWLEWFIDELFFNNSFNIDLVNSSQFYIWHFCGLI